MYLGRILAGTGSTGTTDVKTRVDITSAEDIVFEAATFGAFVTVEALSTAGDDFTAALFDDAFEDVTRRSVDAVTVAGSLGTPGVVVAAVEFDTPTIGALADGGGGGGPPASSARNA